MSFVVLFIVGAFCSWLTERYPFDRKVWLPFVGALAWVVLGFFYPSCSIDAAWSQFLAELHADAETEYERPDALEH